MCWKKEISVPKLSCTTCLSLHFTTSWWFQPLPETYWHTSLQDASRCSCKNSEDPELAIQMIWGERKARQYFFQRFSLLRMTFNIIEWAREIERTTPFKSISFETDNLKNREQKPAGLGLVKSSVHRFVWNLCSFLVDQEAQIKKIGPDSQENLRLIWRFLYL